MSFRNDHDATFARLQAAERELARLRSVEGELQETRDELAQASEANAEYQRRLDDAEAKGGTDAADGIQASSNAWAGDRVLSNKEVVIYLGSFVGALVLLCVLALLLR